MNNNALILKALNVANAGQSLAGYLPAPLANEVIRYIREANIARRLIPSFKQNTRSWTKPKKANAGAAYYVQDGVTAPMTGFSTAQVTWVAKKLMSFTTLDEEAIEDSQPDVIEQVLLDFAEAVAEAEEMAFLSGDPDHTATAPTPDSATTANWFVRDPRKMFEGIFTIAADTATAAAEVDAGAAVFDPDFVNTALYNLGKYGRNKSRIVGLVPCEQAANIRSNTNFKQANVSGLSLASFITGLGSAGEGEGIVTVIYGVPFYEAPHAPAGEVCMYNRSSPEIGDRRQIKMRTGEIIESDQRKYVVSERISFNVNWRDAFVRIHNLSETVS